MIARWYSIENEKSRELEGYKGPSEFETESYLIIPLLRARLDTKKDGN